MNRLMLCAQEIIEKLEEHGVTAYELDALLAEVRDMALMNAPIKTKKEET